MLREGPVPLVLGPGAGFLLQAPVLGLCLETGRLHLPCDGSSFLEKSHGTGMGPCALLLTQCLTLNSQAFSCRSSLPCNGQDSKLDRTN